MVQVHVLGPLTLCGHAFRASAPQGDADEKGGLGVLHLSSISHPLSFDINASRAARCLNSIALSLHVWFIQVLLRHGIRCLDSHAPGDKSNLNYFYKVTTMCQPLCRDKVMKAMRACPRKALLPEAPAAGLHNLPLSPGWPPLQGLCVPRACH